MKPLNDLTNGELRRVLGNRGRWVYNSDTDERWLATGRGYDRINPKLHAMIELYGEPPDDLRITVIEDDPHPGFPAQRKRAVMEGK